MSDRNPLDSSAPLRRRGKEKENPRPKKPSALKAVILRERAAKKLRPAYMGHQHSMSAASEDSLRPLLTSPVIANDGLLLNGHADDECADDEYDGTDQNDADEDCGQMPDFPSGPGTHTSSWSTTSGALPSPVSQLSTPSEIAASLNRAGAADSFTLEAIANESLSRDKKIEQEANSRLHSRRFRE